MIISVLSGKGGTGKTTVAVNLAVSLASKGEKVLLLDADVEEPNAWLYLKPAFDEALPVSIPVPEIDEELCDYCGKCADFCEYNALAVAQGTVLTFLELCHACGGCTLVCPENAIKEVDREIGILEKGKAEAIDFWQGRLNIGEPFAVPVISDLKNGLDELKDYTVIIDCPAGVSCPVIEAVRGSDYALLVTEPTPFGHHDLGIALEMVELLGIPGGVVINRAGDDNSTINELCQQHNVPVLLEIEFSAKLASLGAQAIPFSTALPYWQDIFFEMYQSIKEGCPCAS